MKYKRGFPASIGDIVAAISVLMYCALFLILVVCALSNPAVWGTNDVHTWCENVISKIVKENRIAKKLD